MVPIESPLVVSYLTSIGSNVVVEIFDIKDICIIITCTLELSFGISFYGAALYATRYWWSETCLSVCLSVKRVNCDKTKAPSDKSSIMSNRKSTTSFPVRLRWTAYVAPKPPKGAQKRKMTLFPLKVYFSRRKSAAKFLCVNSQQAKLQGLSRRAQMVGNLVGDVLFYLTFWTKVTPASKTAISNLYLLVARQP